MAPPYPRENDLNKLESILPENAPIQVWTF